MSTRRGRPRIDMGSSDILAGSGLGAPADTPPAEPDAAPPHLTPVPEPAPQPAREAPTTAEQPATPAAASAKPAAPRKPRKAAETAPDARRHQVNDEIDSELKKRLQIALHDLRYDDGLTSSLREVVQALLDRAPLRGPELRELIVRYREDCPSATLPRAERDLVKLNVHVTRSSYRQRERLVSELGLLHDFKTSMTELFSALVWFGPQNAPQLEELLRASRQEAA